MPDDNLGKKLVIRFYGVREAKKNFAKMLKQAQEGAVVILNHSRPVALIISIEGVSMEEAANTLTTNEIGALLEKYRSNRHAKEKP